MVSIICNTYNHENYIKDALDGFLMQRTNFVYEILVHDDASTDKTADIIRNYEKKYPNIIKPIYQTENQYSKGMGTVSKIQFSRVRGKYIALCEGDDFWTDSFKLQKQVDALEQHPEIDICAHKTAVVSAETKTILDYKAPENENTVISAEHVIAGGGGFVATCSLVFRAGLNETVPEFRKTMPFDYTLQIHGALRGGMIYLNENMASYRWLSKGSWSRRIAQTESVGNIFSERVIQMLDVLDKEYNFQYHSSVSEAQLNLKFGQLLCSLDAYKQLMQEPYLHLYQKLDRITQIKIKLKYYFPILLKIKRKLFN